MHKSVVFIALFSTLGAAGWAAPVGDGFTDDTAALQEIFSRASPGQTVTLAPGTYLTGTLWIDRANLTIEASGVTFKRMPNTTIRAARLVSLVANGITLRGLTVDGNGAENTHLGVWSTAQPGSTVNQIIGGPELSSVDGFYVGRTLRFIAGNLRPHNFTTGEDGEGRVVTRYEGATRTFFFADNFSQAPDMNKGPSNQFEVVDESDFANRYNGNTGIGLIGNNIVLDHVSVRGYTTGTVARLNTPVRGNNSAMGVTIYGDNCRIKNTTVDGAQYAGFYLVNPQAPRKQSFRLENCTSLNHMEKGFGYEGAGGYRNVFVDNFTAVTDTPLSSSAGINFTSQNHKDVYVENLELNDIRIEGGNANGVKLLSLGRVVIKNMQVDVERDAVNDPLYVQGASGLRIQARESLLENIVTDDVIYVSANTQLKSIRFTSDFPKVMVIGFFDPNSIGATRINAYLDDINATAVPFVNGRSVIGIDLGTKGTPIDTRFFLNNHADTTSEPLLRFYGQLPSNTRPIVLGPNIQHGGLPLAVWGNTVLDSTIVYLSQTASSSQPLIAEKFKNSINPRKGERLVLPLNTALDAELEIDLLDRMGRQLMVLYNGPATNHLMTVEWNGQLKNGEYPPSGLYSLRIRHNGDTQTEKIIIVK